MIQTLDRYSFMTDRRFTFTAVALHTLCANRLQRYTYWSVPCIIAVYSIRRLLTLLSDGLILSPRNLPAVCGSNDLGTTREITKLDSFISSEQPLNFYI